MKEMSPAPYILRLLSAAYLMLALFIPLSASNIFVINLFALIVPARGYTSQEALRLVGCHWILLLMASVVLNLVLAFGTSRLKSWAWTLGLSTYALTLLVTLLFALPILGPSIPLLIIALSAVAILIMLLTPYVRRAFVKHKVPPATS